jgi:hypothetical protein
MDGITAVVFGEIDFEDVSIVLRLGQKNKVWSSQQIVISSVLYKPLICYRLVLFLYYPKTALLRKDSKSRTLDSSW